MRRARSPCYRAPLGHLTAYPADKPRLDCPVELWPRHATATGVTGSIGRPGLYPQTSVPPQVRNVRKLTHVYALFTPLSTSPRRIIGLNRANAGESWLAQLPEQVSTRIREIVEPFTRRCADLTNHPREGLVEFRIRLTYVAVRHGGRLRSPYPEDDCARRRNIAEQEQCGTALDEATRRMLPYHERHLDRLGDLLLAHYEKKIAAAKMSGKALAGEMPFRWRTDLDYSWMGGWRKNQDAEADEFARRDSRPKPPRSGHHGRPL